MADFDPERFENKYEHYFPELQRAYRTAFEAMRTEFDSELVHAIDQRVLSESEPFYEDGSFRVELPDDAAERVPLDVPDDELADAFARYRATIEAALYDVFDLDPPDDLPPVGGGSVCGAAGDDEETKA